MKKSTLIAISISIWMIVLALLITCTPNVQPRVSAVDENGLFVIVNEYRESIDLEPYILNENICKMASVRLDDMQAEFSHAKFKERTLDYHFNQFGEDLARGYLTNEELLQAWIDSPTHKEVLEYSYPFACIRCNSIYCVFENAK